MVVGTTLRLPAVFGFSALHRDDMNKGSCQRGVPYHSMVYGMVHIIICRW